VPVTRYGVSPWVDRVPSKKRPTHAAYKGLEEVPLVIIGGGLAGVMTAYACAVAGQRAVLLEADRLGSGGSGRSSGVCAGEAGLSFRELEAAAGRRTARAHAEQSRKSVMELAAAVKRLKIKADFEVLDAIRIVPDGWPLKDLQKEVEARKAASLDVTWQSPSAARKSTGADTAGAARLTPWAQCDPYMLVLGFAAAAASRGVRIFERTAVTSITFDRKVATVITAGGSLVSPCVVHATGEPGALVKGLKRHFTFAARGLALSEVLPPAVRKALGPRAAIVCDVESPPHTIRWTADHRALVAGADGDRPGTKKEAAFHLQRTGQLMYELSRLYPVISGVPPAFGWSLPLAHAADGGLYAGPHRNFPHQLFAFGTAHDPARAFLASRILLRHVMGEATAADEQFGFARIL
jgi:glycine/D-amino acid oxidase-like deaminating enzyme